MRAQSRSSEQKNNGKGIQDSRGKREGRGGKEWGRERSSISICYLHTSPLIYSLVSIVSIGASPDIVPNNLSDRAENVDRLRKYVQ